MELSDEDGQSSSESGESGSEEYSSSSELSIERDPFGPLYDYIRADDFENFSRLIRELGLGQVLGHDFVGDNNVFHVAAEFDSQQIMKYLLSLHYDIARVKLNAQREDGNTPLHLAVMNGEYGVGMDMLDHPHIILFFKNEDQKTALHVAIIEGEDEVAVKIIRTAAARNLNIEDYNEEANERREQIAKRKQRREAKEQLGDFLGSEIDNSFCGLKDFIGYELYEELLESNFELNPLPENFNDKDDGFNYLQLATTYGRSRVVFAILDTGLLDPRSRDKAEESQRRAISAARDRLALGLARRDEYELPQISSERTAQESAKIFKQLESYFNSIRRCVREGKTTRSEKKLKSILSSLPTIDLLCLQSMCEATFSSGPGNMTLLEGFIKRFNTPTKKSKSKTIKVPLTSEDFNNYLTEALRGRDTENISQDDCDASILTNQFVKTYIVLVAGHYNLYQDDSSGFSDQEYFDEEEKYCKKQVEALRNVGGGLEYWQPEHRFYSDNELMMSGGKSFVPIFRGMTYRLDLFSQRESLEYAQKEHKTIYSAACYHLAGYEVGDPRASVMLLEQQANIIDDFMRDLSNEEFFNSLCQMPGGNKLRGFLNLRHYVQKVYTQSKDGFEENLSKSMDLSAGILEAIQKRYPRFQAIFEQNPFMSGSLLPRHAGRYQYGKSRANSQIDLLRGPRYKKNGKPKYQVAGLIYIALYPIDRYRDSQAYNIPQLHAESESMCIAIEFLNETEITFPGRINYVVCTPTLTYPDFSDEYYEQMTEDYGISKREFDSIKKKILQPRHTPEHRAGLDLLRDKLVDHFEIRLMKLAIQEAQKRGGQVVFQHPNGLYTTSIPTPHYIATEARLIRKSKFVGEEPNLLTAKNSRVAAKKLLESAQFSPLKNRPDFKEKEEVFDEVPDDDLGDKPVSPIAKSQKETSRYQFFKDPEMAQKKKRERQDSVEKSGENKKNKSDNTSVGSKKRPVELRPEDRGIYEFRLANFLPIEVIQHLLESRANDGNYNFNHESIMSRDLPTSDTPGNMLRLGSVHADLIQNLLDHETAVIVINIDDAHFTVLGVRKIAGVLTAVYADSYGDYHGTQIRVRDLCRLWGIQQLTCLNDVVRGGYQSNNDCAIHTYRNSLFLVGATDEEFTARHLWANIQREGLDQQQRATEVRFAMARELDDFSPVYKVRLGINRVVIDDTLRRAVTDVGEFEAGDSISMQFGGFL